MEQPAELRGEKFLAGFLYSGRGFLRGQLRAGFLDDDLLAMVEIELTGRHKTSS
jgi:hypothetical protein